MSHDVSISMTVNACFRRVSSILAPANHFPTVPHTSKAATTSTPQACPLPSAATPSASCGRQSPATSSLPYSSVLAVQRRDQAVVVEGDEVACFQEIDGARGIEEALSIRRSLWMVRGLRSLERRPRSKKETMRNDWSGVLEVNKTIDCLIPMISLSCRCFS